MWGGGGGGGGGWGEGAGGREVGREGVVKHFYSRFSFILGLDATLNTEIHKHSDYIMAPLMIYIHVLFCLSHFFPHHWLRSPNQLRMLRKQTPERGAYAFSVRELACFHHPARSAQ